MVTEVRDSFLASKVDDLGTALKGRSLLPFFVTHKEEDNLFEEIMDMIDEHHRIFETGGYASWSKRHKGRTN